MRLQRLSVANFRNIFSISMEPCERFNFFYGFNGQGKTNLLEAIYLLGSPRSFRTTRLPELINHGEQVAHVDGWIRSGGIQSVIKIALESSGRRVTIDGKAVHRASDLHGRLNAVLFSPDDTGMIRMGPETRRRYLDRAVYTSDISYLHCWQEYQRILKQRNKLLKFSDKTGLDIWTEKLAVAGGEVIERRLKFVAALDCRMRKHYSIISDNCEMSQISYQPDGVQSSESGTITGELLELFRRHERSDERYGTTTAGPHRDDLTFLLNERQLKAFGSNGQQKSFVLALKMAEMDNLDEIFGESPLFLLDDMSSELDARRNHNLTEFLAARDIQVFVTSTERYPAMLDSALNCAVFCMKDGNLTFEGKK